MQTPPLEFFKAMLPGLMSSFLFLTGAFADFFGHGYSPQYLELEPLYQQELARGYSIGVQWRLPILFRKLLYGGHLSVIRPLVPNSVVEQVEDPGSCLISFSRHRHRRSSAIFVFLLQRNTRPKTKNICEDRDCGSWSIEISRSSLSLRGKLNASGEGNALLGTLSVPAASCMQYRLI